MNLLLLRSSPTVVCTLGDLLLGEDVNGPWQCYTLEDPWHEKKVYGDTCIPTGTYEVVLAHSNRFKRKLPRLLNVPGFDGVLIHGGNTKEDTHGCILVGQRRGVNSINTCAPALEKVIGLISATDKNFITVREANAKG